MKFLTKYRAVILLTSFLYILSSCRKFVEIPPPSTQLVTSSVFSDDGSATAAMLAVYTMMYRNAESFNFSVNSGLLSDELTTTNSYIIPFYQNALFPISAPDWVPYYNYIYQVNAVIEGLNTSSALSPSIKKQLVGEADFLRAFWYFYLVNCYGDIPLTLSTDYTVNSKLSRTAKSRVYEQIIADLKDANQLLNSQFVDASDTAVTVERVRPTQGAASALLARAYLYTQKYDSAILESSKVISNPLFTLEPTLENVFLANDNEAIWQLQTVQPSGGTQTYDAYNFIFTPDNTVAFNFVSPWLMKSFEPGDQRKVNWIGNRVVGTDTFYFPFKYQVWHDDPTHNPTGRTEYSMVLRLAEQYLIRSEAEAELGDSSSAITDLNMIRTRAGLANYDPNINGPLLSAVLHERQVELFTEWGHRWFDLIRTGNVNAVLGSPENICMQKGGIWAPYKSLYPIAQVELNTDPNLVQNPGY